MQFFTLHFHVPSAWGLPGEIPKYIKIPTCFQDPPKPHKLPSGHPQPSKMTPKTLPQDTKSVDPRSKCILEPLSGGLGLPYPPTPFPCWTPFQPDAQKHSKTRINHRNVCSARVLEAAPTRFRCHSDIFLVFLQIMCVRVIRVATLIQKGIQI